MDALLETIRLAVASDAGDEARAAGASACRTLLTALEATPGETMPAPAITPPPIDPAQIGTAVTMLRSMPVDQLLDLAIARLRAALPAGETVPGVQPMRLQLVPVSNLRAEP